MGKKKKDVKLSAKIPVEVGGMSFGKKDTAKLSLSFKFEAAEMDANSAQALLAAGALRCKLDRGPDSQPNLPLEGARLPVRTVSLDCTCHRIGMDMTTCAFGLSFPKSAAEANTLADFAGQDAKLTVTRRADIDTIDEGEPGSEPEESPPPE